MEEDSKTKYMQFIIQDICDKIGPRPPCSKKEADCAEYIEKEFKKYSNETKIEKFYCHPGSYRAQYRIPMINLIISTFFYWIYFFKPDLPFLIISLTCNLISIIVIQTNILRNTEFIDPFFKKKESTNVFAKFKPKGDKKKIIVIGGHHDANWEYSILKKSIIAFGLSMAIPIVFSHLLFGVLILKNLLYTLSIKYLFLPEIDLGLLIFLTIISPFLIYSIIKCVSNIPVLGVDDNLTAIAVIMALAQYLNLNGLNNTEVWLVSHGCEEIGDRGSKRFSKEHYNELKDAIVINLDMIGGKKGFLKFITSEVMGIIKLNKKIVAELSKIAETFNIPYHSGLVQAFTDSTAYSQNKIKAGSIVNMPKKGFPRHYHTRNDTIDKIEFKNLWNCYRIIEEFIKNVDSNKILI